LAVLYSLFIDDRIALPRWLTIRSLEERAS
jgi:hypothetical protein